MSLKIERLSLLLQILAHHDAECAYLSDARTEEQQVADGKFRSKAP